MNGLHHSVKNEQPALARLFKRTGEDLLIDTLDFDVHLDCGDAALGARNLKVHIAHEVLKALNIGEYCNVAGAVVLDKTHRTACNGSLDGNACIHKRERAAADGSLGS